MILRPTHLLSRLFRSASGTVVAVPAVRCFMPLRAQYLKPDIRLAHSSRAPLDPNSAPIASVSAFFVLRLFDSFACKS